jgi:spermidine synthase
MGFETGTGRRTLYALTFVVALCSFAYELVYSELLTVVYGGTVTQYGLTVGLFFFSLGVGSFLARTLDHDRPSNFFRTELLLAVVAPAGVLYILALGTVVPPQWLPPSALEWAARLPVVLVGLLSGFELPLLTALVADTASDGDGLVAAVGRRLSGAVYGLVGLVFAVSTDGNDVDSYSLVLGMDYLGGLAGSLVYVFVLYPRVGLLATVFVLGLLNGLAALAFAAGFGGFSRERSPGRSLRPTLVAVCLVVALVYGGLAANYRTVDEELTSAYMEATIEAEYPGGNVDATVTDVETTQYQRVTRYTRTWTGDRENPYFEGDTERCLRLDTAVQLCDSWARPYHHGLADVPMTLFENGSETDVLVVGGGDFVAVDHLREYGVDVDLVDIDGEFMSMARDSEWLAQYHDHAYRYDRLNVSVGDAYDYLTDSDERYDLILLDLPGATDDDLLGLYSVQFYEQLRRHLTDGGLVGTWTYSQAAYGDHHAAYANTVRAAGFTHALEYWAHGDIDGDDRTERVERFKLFSPDATPSLDPDDGGAYVDRYGSDYADTQWEPITRHRGAAVNGRFDPNYDILIDT